MCTSTTCRIETCFMGSGMFCHDSLLFHDTANDNNVAMSQHSYKFQYNWDFKVMIVQSEERGKLITF